MGDYLFVFALMAFRLFLRPVVRGPLRRLEFVPVRCLSVSAQCANLTGAVEMAPINAPSVVHQWLQSVKSRLAPDFLNAKSAKCITNQKLVFLLETLKMSHPNELTKEKPQPWTTFRPQKNFNVPLSDS